MSREKPLYHIPGHFIQICFVKGEIHSENLQHAYYLAGIAADFYRFDP